MRFIWPIAFCALFTFPAAAAEISPQRFDELKMNCDTCHGVRGISVVPDQTPSIAGKSEKYILTQLEAFRSGKRRHDTMGLMGATMTDEEMKAIARYYARVKR